MATIPEPKLLRCLLGLGLFLACAGAVPADVPDPDARTGDELTPEQREFLAEVAPLISEEERAAFLSLERPHRREAFITAFWQTRDPFPETAGNEFREVWRARRELVETRFGNLDDDRARVVLWVGPPDRIDGAPCPGQFAGLEIWHFGGRDHGVGPFDVVFERGVGRYRLWSSLDGLPALLGHSAPLAGTDRDLRQEIQTGCFGGYDLLATLERALSWEALESVASIPRPSGEWLATFLSRSTDVPDAAGTFEAAMTVSYPGRNQSRTVVQMLIAIPASEAQAAAAGAGTYQFLIDGEILREERLFESFRYRFDLPASELRGGRIPLALQRYLRPGDYSAVVKVRDLVADAFYRVETPLRVPWVAAGAATEPPGSGSPPAPSAGEGAEDLLAEANAALDSGDERLTLIAPVDELLTGRVRIHARVSGTRISKVAFLLNGREVMSKSRPPYSVEINLGHAPRLHVVDAYGFDEDGRELTRDRLSLNAGPHRFGIRLREPTPGLRYQKSLRASAEVALPLGAELDRVEIFLNETRLATLYQEPFVQPIVLPEAGPITYVRAVAYLTDGNSTEDLVFVNAPPDLERLEIDFVELYASVVDRRGRPVDTLEREDFEVSEDGEPQQLLRFERVRDLPIYAGLVIDTSTSMAKGLRDAERAALRFLERVIEPEDRAAVFVFSDRPELRVPLTNNLQVLAGGLSGIVAEGETALYDSVVRSVFYFAGIKGKRAVILLTDGRDSVSQHTFAEALAFAQRAGVAVYAIGIDLSSADHEVRSLLTRLAHETGGDAFFIERASQLEAIYERVEEELRSQYLLAYQSPQTESTAFRRVQIRIADPDLRVRSIPGYYP